MANTFTKRDLFQGLLELPQVQENELFIQGLEHELELLDRKKASGKTESKITEEIKNKIYQGLVKYPEGTSIKNLIMNEFPNEGYTSQKLVPILNALRNENKVERFLDKKTAMFKVID